MSFEDDISALNQAYFFREFTYSNAKFRISSDFGVGEVELADGLLWVDTGLVVYQLKEREQQPNTTSGHERAWFEVRNASIENIHKLIVFNPAP